MDLQGSKISRVWYRSEISRIYPYITRITLEFRAFAHHAQIRFWAGSEAQSQTQGAGFGQFGPGMQALEAPTPLITTAEGRTVYRQHSWRM